MEPAGTQGGEEMGRAGTGQERLRGAAAVPVLRQTTEPQSGESLRTEPGGWEGDSARQWCTVGDTE